MLTRHLCNTDAPARLDQTRITITSLTKAIAAHPALLPDSILSPTPVGLSGLQAEHAFKKVFEVSSVSENGCVLKSAVPTA
jgi:hypothetical protein